VNPLPVVTITPIGPFCDNNPPQTLTATPTGGTWGGAATGNNFNPMTNGPGIHTVTYTYSDANDCTTTATMDIEVFDSPDVSIDPTPAEFCDSENSIILTATGSGGAGNYSYSWNTPTGTGTGDTYTASLPGQYKVTVTDENNCTHSAVTTVVVHPNPDVQINDPGPICESVESLVLTASPTGGTFSGSIITSNGLLYPNMIDPGTYDVSYSFVDAFGCEGVDALQITIVTTPNAITDNNGPLCAGQPILLFGSTDGTGATISYLWTGPGGYTSNLQNPTNATLGGDYTLQVTIDGCPSPPSVTTVSLTDQPDAIATNGGPYCNGQNIQLFGSTNSTGSNITYTWSGPNGYVSDLQNPTNAIDEGFYSLVVTADGCVSATVMTEVIFNSPPDAVATNMGPYCAGDTIQLFGNTNTPGNVINYTWNGPNGYTSTLQNPKGLLAPGLYQLTVNVDGCNSSIDSTQVIINAAPQPVISGQASFCTGFSSLLNAGAGYASYVWNDASTNQTLEVFSSGTYQVTVTDGNGCTGIASFTATETASLAPVITGSLAFCEGSGTTLDAGAGFTSYTWSTGETSQTITVTTQGNFGVIVTDADGCSGSANITTTLNLNPAVVIGGSTTYCIGGSTVLDAGAGYASYNWSNNATTQTITVSSPGTYSVDVVDIHGCAGSGSTTVDESTSLHPVITGNDKFCENGSTTLNAGSGFATYLWSDGSTNQNLVVSTAGVYSVTVSDGQSCFGDSSITVTEVLPPSATLQPSATLCNTQAGGSILNLFDLILAGDMSGSWADVDQSGAVGLFNNLDFANIAAGDYHFMYTTNSAVAPCPESTYNVVVTVMDCACPDVFFLNAAPLCNSGDILNLSTIANTLEPGTWSILQTPPGTNPAILNGSNFNATGGDPGQYTIQFTLQNQPPPGCPLDFQVVVNVDASVDAGVASLPLSYCFNDADLVSLGNLISGEDANGIWTESSSIPSQGSAFNPANGTFSTGNQVAGTYTFNYALPSNGACPADATEVSVVINPLPVATIMDLGVLDCTHTTQSLDASGSSFGPAFDITWSGSGIVPDGNEKTLHPTINQPGQYVLTVTNKQTGCFQTDSVDAIQNTDAPSSALVNSQNPSCFGDQNAVISIGQVTGGTPPYLFSINHSLPASNNVFNNLSAGDYVIELIDAGGCRWDTMITIVGPTEFTVDLGDDIDLDLGDDATVQAVVSLPSNLVDTLIWSPEGLIECFDLACLEGTVHTFNTVTLTATVVDVNGCRNTDQITIRVKKTRKVFISTAFSPNEDGINDIFFIQGSDRQIKTIKKFVIYNRWGDLVHEAVNFKPNDPSKGWDGNFHGEKMNPGVFVYRAEIEFLDGLTEYYTGDVTLMK
jgi:gliding motility-associated-like protein